MRRFLERLVRWLSRIWRDSAARPDHGIDRANETLDVVARELTALRSLIGYRHPAHFPALDLSSLMLMQAADFFRRHLFDNPKYTKSKRITAYQKRIYSVCAEDGIIEEIFERVGMTNRVFVEMGVGHRGEQNNSLYLLLKGWSGLWIEGSPDIASGKAEGPPHLIHYRHVDGVLDEHMRAGRLKIRKEYVSAENAERFLDEADIPIEFDMLSIDIDGNDYWVWKALVRHRPRVVCMEYNSNYGDTIACAMRYDPDWRWDGSTIFGASLAALEKLGREKGYCLVGCDFIGINAYFVREDLVGDLFEAPFTSHNHFEPNRVFLVGLPGNWHTPGPFVPV